MVTRPTAMTWLRLVDSRLASSGARTRNPPTTTWVGSSSSTTETTAMTRYGSSQPRVAATTRVPTLTGPAASCTCAPPTQPARRSLNDPAADDKTAPDLG